MYNLGPTTASLGLGFFTSKEKEYLVTYGGGGRRTASFILQIKI